jgi:costal 2 protein
MLECEEAIEAIDAAIEYKNELICGRKGQGLDNSRVQRERVSCKIYYFSIAS